VNVNAEATDFPEEVRPLATSMAIERGHPVPRALFAAAALGALEEWLDRHAADGFEPVREAWRSMSDTLGREVRVKLAGAADLVGVAEDVDASGALLVRAGGRLERVLAGDVELLRPR
jgi:BirA family biotin operon repressor/biotin-[acetyl-CoA-carboxylase] ligase